MESYLMHESSYVYWSTPPRQCSHMEISKGTRAYIWRTLSDAGPREIVAVGAVQEAPQPLSSRSKFVRAERLNAPGWSERDASSEWKTGILLQDIRLRPESGMLLADELASIVPGLSILRNPRGTVFRVDDEQTRSIDGLWKARQR